MKTAKCPPVRIVRNEIQLHRDRNSRLPARLQSLRKGYASLLIDIYR